MAAGHTTGMDAAALDGQMVGAPFFATANALIDRIDADRAAGPAAGAQQ